MTKTEVRTHPATHVVLRVIAVAIGTYAAWTCARHHVPVLPGLAMTLCTIAVLFQGVDRITAQVPTRDSAQPAPAEHGQD